jgi:hypothetical protein
MERDEPISLGHIDAIITEKQKFAGPTLDTVMHMVPKDLSGGYAEVRELADQGKLKEAGRKLRQLNKTNFPNAKPAREVTEDSSSLATSSSIFESDIRIGEQRREHHQTNTPKWIQRKFR